MIIINGSFSSVMTHAWVLSGRYLLVQPFVWWCIVVSQSVMQEGWFAIVKVRVCLIRTGLFDASTELQIFLYLNLV